MFNFLENDILFVIIYHFIKNMKQKYATKYIKKNVTDACKYWKNIEFGKHTINWKVLQIKYGERKVDKFYGKFKINLQKKNIDNLLYDLN